MTRFAALRLDWIDARLLNAGAVCRDDICQTFGISMAQASHDIAAFQTAHPEAMRYDKSAKRYVPANGRYRPVRGAKPGPMRIEIPTNL